MYQKISILESTEGKDVFEIQPERLLKPCGGHVTFYVAKGTSQGRQLRDKAVVLKSKEDLDLAGEAYKIVELHGMVYLIKYKK
jgi:hypothetical protein